MRIEGCLKTIVLQVRSPYSISIVTVSGWNLQYSQVLLSVIHFGFIYPWILQPIVSYLYVAISYLLKRPIYCLTISKWCALSFIYYEVLWCSWMVTVFLLLFSSFYFTKGRSWSCITCCPIRSSLFNRNDLLAYHFSWSSPLYVQINQFITGRL